MHSAFRFTQESHLCDSYTTSNSRATSSSLHLLQGNSGTGDASGDKDVSWCNSCRRTSSCLSCSKRHSSALCLSHPACTSHSSHTLRSSSRQALSAMASASLCSTSLHSFSHHLASFISSKQTRAVIWASNALADDMVVSVVDKDFILILEIFRVYREQLYKNRVNCKF